jgi:hypothetical protein
MVVDNHGGMWLSKGPTQFVCFEQNMLNRNKYQKCVHIKRISIRSGAEKRKTCPVVPVMVPVIVPVMVPRPEKSKYI